MQVEEVTQSILSDGKIQEGSQIEKANLPIYPKLPTAQIHLPAVAQ